MAMAGILEEYVCTCFNISVEETLNSLFFFVVHQCVTGNLGYHHLSMEGWFGVATKLQVINWRVISLDRCLAWSPTRINDSLQR